MRFEISYCVQPASPEDAHAGRAVHRRHDGRVLFGLLEPGARGPRSREVLDVAESYLSRADLGRGLHPVVRDMHEILSTTVGLTTFLSVFDGDAVHMAAVGGFRARAHGMPLHFESSDGLLGHRLERIRCFTQRFVVGARLMAVNHGVEESFRIPQPGTDAQAACDHVSDRFAIPGRTQLVVLADRPFDGSP